MKKAQKTSNLNFKTSHRKAIQQRKHTWIPRVVPVQCPKCKSYYWNEVNKEFDRRKKEFKDNTKKEVQIKTK